MIAQSPINFDRASGALEGANLWERTAALALSTGSKISSHFSHRGYIGCANLLRKTLPERSIVRGAAVASSIVVSLMIAMLAYRRYD